ncbi:hypothetical protein [Cupriavidus necator]
MAPPSNAAGVAQGFVGVSVTYHDDLKDARRLRDALRCPSDVFSVGVCTRA